MMPSREAIEYETGRIADAINATPEWHAASAVFGRDKYGWWICVMARHREEESMRLIRSIGEWEQEKREHVCPVNN